MQVEREDHETRSSEEEPREEPEDRAAEREEEGGGQGCSVETIQVWSAPPAPAVGATPASPTSSRHTQTQRVPAPEPCWYCLRSLESQLPPASPQQEESQPWSLLPPGGQKVTYQADPRPHFGVARSSHSPCRPLWGGQGPSWAQRAREESQKSETCPHCHLSLPADTLRWHEAKCQRFEGTRTQRK